MSRPGPEEVCGGYGLLPQVSPTEWRQCVQTERLIAAQEKTARMAGVAGGEGEAIDLMMGHP